MTGRVFALALLTAISFYRNALADPCEVLAGQVGASSGPAFVVSFPTAPPGPLKDAAFLYDNAVAAIALVGCGRVDQARRIGDAILFALDHDRFWHDGRLRNAYRAGPVDPLKLPGWWDNQRQAWLEDRYQVGSDSGNMAWAMLALLALDQAGAGPAYRTGAERIGLWVAERQDHRGAGGFTGGTFGHEPSPTDNLWKSTEHNTDLAAAFHRLAQVTGNPSWRDRAAEAARFVEAMWDPARDCYATGTTEDGVTVNPIVALDAQAWPPLALPQAASHSANLLAVLDRRVRDGTGFAYSDSRGGVWTEGTAQTALLLALTGRTADAGKLMAVIEAQRAPEGGYYATSVERLPTGFALQTDPSQPRLYFHLPHLAATAWAALASTRFNPFTGTRDLPGQN